MSRTVLEVSWALIIFLMTLFGIYLILAGLANSIPVNVFMGMCLVIIALIRAVRE